MHQSGALQAKGDTVTNLGVDGRYSGQVQLVEGLPATGFIFGGREAGHEGGLGQQNGAVEAQGSKRFPACRHV